MGSSAGLCWTGKPGLHVLASTHKGLQRIVPLPLGASEVRDAGLHLRITPLSEVMMWHIVLPPHSFKQKDMNSLLGVQDVLAKTQGVFSQLHLHVYLDTQTIF